MNQQIRIDVCHAENPERQAWLTMTISKTTDDRIVHDVSIRRALASAGGDDGLPPSHCQVLKAEITAGILTGLRKAGRGWHIVLDRLGGADGDSKVISTLPSIGWAVAATLAVVHGTGQEDLEAEPHGGHGWQLERVSLNSF